jgi:hypothetical protein
MAEQPDASPPALPKITIWPAAQLRAALVDPDMTRRLTALAMALLPEAPAHECVPELIDCTTLPDPMAQRMAAIALGGQSASDKSASALARLVAEDKEMPVRIAAAHAMFRIVLVPVEAHPGLANMLIADDAPARQIAQQTLTKADARAASAVAGMVGKTPAEKWTTELLASLAFFAKDGDARRKVEAWLMDILRKTALLPAGIAGYTALASMAGGGPGLEALVKVAVVSSDDAERKAALDAIGNLGKAAASCAPALGALLKERLSAELEVLLCQTLVKITAPAKAMPLATVIERIRGSEASVAAAHAMLVALAGKAFMSAADALVARHREGPVPLRPALEAAYKGLLGKDLLLEEG